MPRTKRHTIPGVIYHLISRFVDRDWFIQAELERHLYLGLLGKALEASTWRCLAYAIMSNHIHLAMIAGDDPLADWVRAVHSPFADTMNRSHGRIGPMFVRGPKSILVPDAGVAALIAYIHNNPVRAQVVEKPADTTWTSHRCYLGLQPVPRWLHVREGLARAEVTRGRAFDELVRSTSEHPVLGPVTSDAHLEELVDVYERKRIAEIEVPPVPDRYSTALHIVAAVSDELGISLPQICSRRRGGAETTARAAVIACGVQLGCSNGELARALGITKQAVSKLARTGRTAAVNALAERVMRTLKRAA